jgi:uncharacterized OB-fold protein
MPTELRREINARRQTPTKGQQCRSCGALALDCQSECAGCGGDLVAFDEWGGR